MSICIWLTGPSGAGKTTIAEKLKEKIKEKNKKVVILDGDEIRRTLYPDLGFEKSDRELHNKVVINIAKTLVENNIIVIVSLISPYRRIREFARETINDFLEVYVYATLYDRIKRDPKGLYKKAINGEIRNLTGYDGIYEEPEDPEIFLNTSVYSIEECVDEILKYLEEKKVV